MSFWAELKRRKIVQVAIVYAITAWLLMQIIVTIEAPLSLPAWADTLVIVLLVLGFPVTLIVSWAFNVTPEGLVRDRGERSGRPVEGGKTLEYLLIGLLIAAVSWLFYRDLAAPGDQPTASASDAQAAREPEPTRQRDVLPNSVAVLLCDNFSTDPENGFFAASLHEEMLNQLVKLRGLNVIARTSVLQYAGAERPIPEIAADLKVKAVMECSVAYGDGRIVISAQLIDGDTGLHIWSERYNREFTDIFGIQSDIAMNVANALAVEFSVAEQQAIEQAPTESPEAYALYLEGLSLRTLDAPAALDLFTRALEFDPEFAAAHARKSMLHQQALINSTGANAVEAGERERQMALSRFHAERAAAIDPAFSWVAAGTAAFTTWRWGAIVAAAETAPDPLDQGVVWTHSYVGEHEWAIARARRGVELNPRDWNQVWTLGVALAYAGQRDEAARVLRDAIALAPAVPVLRSWLAYIEIARGNEGSASTELARSEQLLGDDPPVVFLPELAYSYARLGRRDDTNRIVSEIESNAEAEIGAGGRAMVHLARGDRAAAIEQLERGIEKVMRNEIDEGFFNLVNIRMNVWADPVLEEPEFVSLREQLRGR